MFIYWNPTTKEIYYASNIKREWRPEFLSESEVLGDAEKYAWPGLSGPSSCLYDGAIIPNPAVRRTKDETDASAAKQYAKLQALVGMTPAQVTAWVDANVTNLSQAQDAIKTLAIAVSVLARKI